MNFEEIIDFLDHIDEHTEQEIMLTIKYIKDFFRWNTWSFIREYLYKIFDNVNNTKALYELFKDEKKFSYWEEEIDIPEKLKFGVEIEVADVALEKIQYIFESNAISTIMEILEVPTDISNAIIQNSDFEKKNEFNKWIFSAEHVEESEASSPIMTKNSYNLNQIVAVCTLLKALNARLHGGTGLHINIGVDYLECNKDAVKNLLKIWGECEELFFKMANPEGEEIRVQADTMAVPIKENIFNFFEGDGSITLETEEDMERFLYQIQARNRLDRVIAWARIESEDNLESDLEYAETEEEKFQIYHRYEQGIKKKEDEKSQVRWTSINFNHMEWNSDSAGRIEIRIFNSSLEPEIIFQDLELVGKIFEVSLENAKNPNYKKDEFEKLFLRDVTETDKVNHLLNLLFDREKQKNIFKRRWQSVRENRKYIRYRSGIDTFERE